MRKAIFMALAILILIIPVHSVFAFTPTHKFTNQLQNPESQLYNYGSRYYNPSIGRFIQPDPLQNFLVTPELEKRTGMNLEQILKNPQRLNAYSYGLNNPINVTDPTGEVSQARQERFDQISVYIRNDENYWLIRDRDGNAKALDAIWNKCLELSKNKKGETNIGHALDTFYDAVRIDWASQHTLDKSEDDFWSRFNNLPTALSGEYGNDRSNIDKIQHFAASARLAWKYGGRVAGLIGQIKEIKDGLRALFDQENGGYSELNQNDEGYSWGDILANQTGIFWLNEYQAGQINPSDVINNLY